MGNNFLIACLQGKYVINDFFFGFCFYESMNHWFSSISWYKNENFVRKSIKSRLRRFLYENIFFITETTPPICLINFPCSSQNRFLVYYINCSSFIAILFIYKKTIYIATLEIKYFTKDQVAFTLGIYLASFAPFPRVFLNQIWITNCGGMPSVKDVNI